MLVRGGWRESTSRRDAAETGRTFSFMAREAGNWSRVLKYCADLLACGYRNCQRKQELAKRQAHKH